MPIFRIPKPVAPAVPALKEAVPQPTPVKPKPVTNGTIPTNVTEAFAKVPTALALQQFPAASGDLSMAIGNGVVVGAAGLQNQIADQPTLNRQAAVARLDEAEALVQDAFAKVTNPDATEEDRQIAQREMAEAAEIRGAVGGALPELMYRWGPNFQDFFANANALEQQAFLEVQATSRMDQILGALHKANAASQFQFIDECILFGADGPPSFIP